MAEIVSFTREHIDSICEIETESFSDPWSRRSFFELLDSPFALGFTAIEDAEVAGYLIAHHISPEIEILNIAVKKSKRRKKIATELFLTLFEYAKSEKAEKLTLELRASNRSAFALYKKLGFALDGFRKNYYANPKEDALLMSVILINN